MNITEHFVNINEATDLKVPKRNDEASDQDVT